jgi:hypothetical protein
VTAPLWVDAPAMVIDLPDGFRPDYFDDDGSVSYRRHDLFGREVGRVDISTVGPVGPESPDAVVDRVLDALCDTGGLPVDRTTEIIDGVRITAAMLWYPDGLPTDEDDVDEEPFADIAGPGAEVLVAAMAVNGAVHTLAFLSAAPEVLTQVPEFLTSLRSCRFLGTTFAAS